MQEKQLNDAYRRVPPHAKEKSLHSGRADRRNALIETERAVIRRNSLVWDL